MKNKIKIISLTAAIVLFSGCSLISGGADGGVFRSDDAGKTFTQKVTIDEKTKISNTNVLSMAVNPQNGSEIFIGTKESGVFKTLNAGDKWEVVKIASTTPTKVYAVAIDPQNTQKIYVAAVVDGLGKILKSIDSGATWKDVFVEPTEGSMVLAIGINPKNSQKIYAGNTKGQIISSDNGGDTWSNLYEAKSQVFKIAIDNFNPEIIYFAVFQGTMLRTTDGGKTFEDLSEKHIFDRETGLENTASIATDPNRENWVYAGTGTGLFRSKDRGENWELVRVLNRPKENIIRTISINPGNSDEIVYGASQAFYKSVDGGQSWATIQLAGKRTIETSSYNRQNPGIIYLGMNSR